MRIVRPRNPWARNPWFESVAVAQRRAHRRLPQPVYSAIVGGSERGQSLAANEAAFPEIELAPHVAGAHTERRQATKFLGADISLPVVFAPTGVQAVHPDGEVAVARAAAARGTAMCLSSFASRSIEEVIAAGAPTFFQVYWSGSRDQIVHRLQRAHDAGARGLIVTLDWSFGVGRDWGSPEIPERLDVRAMVRQAPHILRKPRWLADFVRAGALPDLTVPNLAPGDGPAPGFFGAYYEWSTTPPPSWADIAWLTDQWRQISNTPLLIKGVCRTDDARRAVDVGASGISVSNHGGNNLDGTPAPIRAVHAVARAVGEQIEVVLDGGVRRGSDVVKALALGARCVMIGRAYLWGLAANGQSGAENVIDVLRSGIDSALLALGLGSIDELTPDCVVVPERFHRELGRAASSSTD